jgi:hypothetical protein
MKKTILLGIMSLLFVTNIFAQSSGDNSVYIDQTNADNSTVSITQTGSGNKVGDRTDLIMPAFTIDGNSMDLMIDQNGMNNSIVGNFIGGDSTANITQTGNQNSTTMTMGNFGTNAGTMNLTLTGDNNTTNWTLGSTANAGNYQYNLLAVGNSNAITSTINSKYVENNITITGNSNTYTTTQSGANGTSLIAGHKITSTIIGSQNVVSITQNGTTTPNIVTLNVTGSGTSHTIIQH